MRTAYVSLWHVDAQLSALQDQAENPAQALPVSNCASPGTNTIGAYSFALVSLACLSHRTCRTSRPTCRV